MTREEALSFIGLKEPVNKKTVESKCAERENYFQMLYDNAPNKVIQKIQMQNLDKLNQVREVLLASSAEKIPVPEHKPGPLVAREAPAPGVDVFPEAEHEAVAWLVVHTEERNTETFNLVEGVNFLGRKKRGEAVNSIVIENDPFISRTHALIRCQQVAGRYEFRLYDGDGTRPSVNGIFLNGDDERIRNTCFLRDNDTVQVGTTKLVMKIRKEASTGSEEVKEVLKTGFIRTVDIQTKR